MGRNLKCQSDCRKSSERRQAPMKYLKTTHAKNDVPRFCRLGYFALVFGVILLGSSDATAQNRGDIGIGVEVGSETGVTLKLFPGKTFAYEFLAAWDIGDGVFLNGHAIYQRALDEYPEVSAIYGFGAYVGAYESRRNSFVAGASARFAVAYSFPPFEGYIHLTPRFDLIPGTNFRIGGGIGFRYFLLKK